MSDGSSRSSSPDPTVAAQLQAKLAALYGDVVEEAYPENAEGTTGKTQTVQAKQQPEPGDETSYSFRLFSSTSAPKNTGIEEPAKAESNAQQVIISSPSPPPEGIAAGGFVAARNLGHYFTSHASDWKSSKQAQFTDPLVAVSGSWVAAQALVPNKGQELLWRLRTIKTSRRHLNLLKGLSPPDKVSILDQEGLQKKSKPNKKRRIILRERRRKQEATKAKEHDRQLDREREEREKKTRRNREKKVKKKEKAKLQKAQVNTAVDAS